MKPFARIFLSMKKTPESTPIHALSILDQWETEGRAHRGHASADQCFVLLWANLMGARGLDFTEDPKRINAFRLEALDLFKRGFNTPIFPVRLPSERLGVL